MSAKNFAETYNIELEIYQCSHRCQLKYRVHAVNVQTRTPGYESFKDSVHGVIHDTESELELCQYIAEWFSWKHVKLPNGEVIAPLEIRYPDTEADI